MIGHVGPKPSENNTELRGTFKGFFQAQNTNCRGSAPKFKMEFAKCFKVIYNGISLFCLGLISHEEVS